MLNTMTVKTETYGRINREDFSNATGDWLITLRQGLPFREAHEIGKLVLECAKKLVTIFQDVLSNVIQGVSDLQLTSMRRLNLIQLLNVVIHLVELV